MMTVIAFGIVGAIALFFVARIGEKTLGPYS